MIHRLIALQAGISHRDDYLQSKLDADGKLQEPSHAVLDLNLKAVINTAYLALHHMKGQEPAGGSIVATASVAAFERFIVVDYTAAKHGVLGLVRGLSEAVKAAGLPIRVNGVAPSWTTTGMVPAHITPVIEASGFQAQTPDVVAHSAALLMADSQRNGQLIYSDRGRFFEIESRFQGLTKDIMEGQSVNATMMQMFKMRDQFANGGGAVPGSDR